jgi:hypothetical protein
LSFLEQKTAINLKGGYHNQLTFWINGELSLLEALDKSFQAPGSGFAWRHGLLAYRCYDPHSAAYTIS